MGLLPSRDSYSANTSDILSGQSESVRECEIFKSEIYYRWCTVHAQYMLYIIDIIQIYKYPIHPPFSLSLLRQCLTVMREMYSALKKILSNYGNQKNTKIKKIVPDGWLYCLLYLIPPRLLSVQIWTELQSGRVSSILGQETAGESWADRQQDSRTVSVRQLRSWGARPAIKSSSQHWKMPESANWDWSER